MSRFTAVFILSLLIILSIRFFIFYSNIPVYKDGEHVQFEMTLLQEPKSSGRYQGITANLSSGERLYITVPAYPQYHYGDTLFVKGVIAQKTIRKNSSNSNELTNNQRVISTMLFPEIEPVKIDSAPLAATSFIRQNTIAFFEDTLPPNSAHLLLGIVFGIKQNMSKDFFDNLKTAGVLHIIAASGMNVAMVGGFLSSFFMLFAKRQIALILTCLGIFFYALLSGFEPSIIRAALMGTVAFSAQILGRRALSVYSLFMAAFVMLFVSPYLIFDIGFQLSFLSTLGLSYIRPILEFKKQEKQTIFKSLIINSEINTTVAAQLATLPILLINFGSYSLFSILANGFVLWLIPTLMVLGGLASLAGLIFEPIGQIFLYLSLPFLVYFEKIVSFFAGFGQIELNFPWQFGVGYYILLLAILLYFNGKKVKK